MSSADDAADEGAALDGVVVEEDVDEAASATGERQLSSSKDAIRSCESGSHGECEAIAIEGRLIWGFARLSERRSNLLTG